MNAELRMSNGELERTPMGAGCEVSGATDKLCLSVLNRVR